MAKFSGKIGYAINVEDTQRPGIWTEVVIERQHFGRLVKDFRRYQDGESINQNLTVSNRIKVTADSYITENKHRMRYVMIDGIAWEILSFEMNYPRILINVGGVYNGPLPSPT